MKWVLGMMSGTSLDGVDAALVGMDGLSVVELGPTHFQPYAAADRSTLRACLAAAQASADADWAPGARPSAEDRYADAVRVVTEAHVAAARTIMETSGRRAELIGFHGQTILHRPEARLTVQIGDADALADGLDAPVAFDFRSADVAAGGQGAPLACFYHFELARRAGAAELWAFVNLGGVANVTWVDARCAAPEAPGALMACDTGPASALIDDWMARHGGPPMDVDGAAAARGRVDERVVEELMSDPYFDAPAPKSLDRNAFSPPDSLAALSLEDGAATLTAFSAAALAKAAAAPWAPQGVARWLLCGGGRKNPTLVSALADRIGRVPEPVEALGVDGDMVEAQAFAALAARVDAGAPLSAPGATGAPRPIAGGRIARPHRRGGNGVA